MIGGYAISEAPLSTRGTDALGGAPEPLTLPVRPNGVYLVDVTARPVAGGALTLRYADLPWIGEPTDPDVPNTAYEPRASVPFAFERTIPLYPGRSTRMAVQIGAVEIDNLDGALDAFPGRYAVDGRDVTVRFGTLYADGYPKDAYSPVSRGFRVPWVQYAGVEQRLRTPWRVDGTSTPVSVALTTPWAADDPATAVSSGLTTPWGAAGLVDATLTTPWAAETPAAARITWAQMQTAGPTPVANTLTTPWAADGVVSAAVTTPWAATAGAVPTIARITWAELRTDGAIAVDAAVTTPWAQTAASGATTAARVTWAELQTTGATPVDAALKTPWAALAPSSVRVTFAAMETPFG